VETGLFCAVESAAAVAVCRIGNNKSPLSRWQNVGADRPKGELTNHFIDGENGWFLLQKHLPCFAEKKRREKTSENVGSGLKRGIFLVNGGFFLFLQWGQGEGIEEEEEEAGFGATRSRLPKKFLNRKRRKRKNDASFAEQSFKYLLSANM
jgi:hypothetical protein